MLNDSSNCYEHTCKACGEKFPEGRIDEQIQTTPYQVCLDLLDHTVQLLEPISKPGSL
jgi:hypothetical protein